MDTHKKRRLTPEQQAMREASARFPQDSVLDTDPEDPSQQLDDVGVIDVDPLTVSVQPTAEAEEDLDRAIAETVEGESEAWGSAAGPPEESEDSDEPDDKRR